MRQPLFPFAFALAIAVTGAVAPARSAQTAGPQAVLELHDIAPGAGLGVAFVDALQQAQPWSSTTSDALALDSRGEVLALKPGQTAQRVVYAGGAYPAGDYSLLYEGSGTFAVSGASLEATGPGRAVVHVTAPSTAGLSLTLLATDRQNPARNVRLILPGYDPGRALPPFTPAFVASLRGWNVLRFDTWMHAGTFAASAFWPERPQVARATQVAPNGVAPEYMIALANASAEDPWFTLPVGASDQYAYQFANLVHRTLDPRLHPVFQYGDEVWKPGTAGYAYALMAARNTNIPGAPANAALGWYATRSTRVFALIRQAYGNDSARVRCVVSGPAAQVLALTGRSVDGFALAADTPSQNAAVSARVARAYALPIYAYATLPAQTALATATTRYAAPGTSQLALGSDALPVAVHTQPYARQVPGLPATPLVAPTTLDLGGRPGLAGALGVPLENPDIKDEGSDDWVSLSAGAVSARKSSARALIAVSRPDANGTIRIAAPADTTERILRVYLGIDRGRATFTATLDGTTYSDSSFANPSGARRGVYTLVYRAKSAGETLAVAVAPQSRGAAQPVVTNAILTGRGSLNSFNTNPPDEAVYHNDLLRTGWNNFEPILNTTNVAGSGFGKLSTLSVDGNVLAQPLYLAHVAVAGGTHNVLIVATENDSVYEFDADSGAQLLHVSLGQSQNSNHVGCSDISPVYGITSTPAVDRTTGTLYVVAATEPSAYNFQTYLHALDITTLTDKVTPKLITATATLTNGSTISFNPQNNYNRAGLVYANNSIYISVGSHCDNDLAALSGWLLRYDTSLNQLAAFSTIDDPSTEDGAALASIWMSGFAPAVDSSGNVYVVTGNGSFDINTGGRNYGESVLKLPPNLSKVTSYFTPHNYDALTGGDTDFGSGGVMLLPPQRLIAQHVAVAQGKASILYLLDTDSLGGLTPTDSGAVQVGPVAGGGVWGGPAYYNGPSGQYVYYQPGYAGLRAYAVTQTFAGAIKDQLTLSSTGSSSAGYGGSFPIVSSYLQMPGTGIVWLVQRGSGTLYLEAYDALNVSHRLFHGTAVPWSNTENNGFVSPLVANGKVYVPGTNAIAVFGLSE